jgi:hypothetical protein
MGLYARSIDELHHVWPEGNHVCYLAVSLVAYSIVLTEFLDMNGAPGSL